MSSLDRKTARLTAQKKSLEKAKDYIISVFTEIADSIPVEDTHSGPRRRQDSLGSRLWREKNSTSPSSSGILYDDESDDEDDGNDTTNSATDTWTFPMDDSIVVETSPKARAEDMCSSTSPTAHTGPRQTNSRASSVTCRQGSHWQAKREKKQRLQANAVKAREVRKKKLLKRRLERT